MSLWTEAVPELTAAAAKDRCEPALSRLSRAWRPPQRPCRGGQSHRWARRARRTPPRDRMGARDRALHPTAEPFSLADPDPKPKPGQAAMLPPPLGSAPREFSQPGGIARRPCYSWCCTMPTSHPRIAITRDPELDAAIDKASSLVGANVPTARLVRDLAVRGAHALEAEDVTRRLRRRAFAERVASDNPPWDQTVLERVEDLSA